MTRATLILLGVVCIMFGLIAEQYKYNCSIRQRLENATQTISDLQTQNAAAMQAAASAMCQREAIHHDADKKRSSIQDILAQHPSFRDIPVPDGLRFTWDDPAGSDAGAAD